MVPAFLRTLSVRVLAAFAVLIITFGGTMVWLVDFMDDLGEEIAIVRTGYLNLALSTKDLAARQQQLVQYLREELEDEGSPGVVQRRIKGFRVARDNLLDTVEETLVSMQDLPRNHGKKTREVLATVRTLRRTIKALDADYATLLAAPPIARSIKNPTPPVDATSLELASKARQRLARAEGAILSTTNSLATDQRKRVVGVAQNLEHNANRLLKYTAIVGGFALIGGLLIAVWVSVMLGPLARLREGAVRIARGERSLRIAEHGPIEVQDVAREFNVMTRAIEERERELVRSERLAAVGKMAAMITHEVRNPLSSIALNTELLGDELDQLPEDKAREARALCRAITDEVDRLTAITEEYLAFARLPKPRLAAESVNQVVEALATFVREDLASRGVSLELDLADVPRGMLDEAQIRQSLLNLVRNAAEALADGGTITLATRKGGDGRVEIEVADDGPGIAEDLQARLFDPFFSTKEGGTGLGLALTSQIVRDHGGDIVVRSRPGEGARFTVSLPVAPVES